eukprot:scaffold4643_cov174-Skeletonema_menzelii.AAC.1
MQIANIYQSSDCSANDVDAYAAAYICCAPFCSHRVDKKHQQKRSASGSGLCHQIIGGGEERRQATVRSQVPYVGQPGPEGGTVMATAWHAAIFMHAVPYILTILYFLHSAYYKQQKKQEVLEVT